MTTVATIPGVDEAALVQLAATLEQGSAHPLANAILQAVPAGVLTGVKDFVGIPGLGLKEWGQGTPLVATRGKTFATIRSYVVTAMQRGQSPLTTLRGVLTKEVWLPDLLARLQEAPGNPGALLGVGSGT